MPRHLIGLLVIFALGLLWAPLMADAPSEAPLTRIGLLTSAAGPSPLRDGLLQRLHDLGYRDGHNLAVEERYAGGRHERLAALATDLVQREVAVIVPAGYAAVRAAQQATPTIPIVMLLGGDPIGSGLIPSLARPGGNLTGLANAWPGAKCTTEEGAVATATLTGMERVTSVGASGDEAARRLLFERGIAITLRRLTVFVVERELNYAKIRPEGRLDTLWVRVWELSCAK
jgi:ABC-type uncharacterized transport system substrate-binding protein